MMLKVLLNHHYRSYDWKRIFNFTTKIRRMFQRLIWILVGFLVLVACQEDDVCLDVITPRMKVFFKDSTTDEFITIDTIVVGDTNETNRILYTSVDSLMLQLPLDINSIETSFRIRRDTLTTTPFDDLILNYQIEESFSSKACGVQLNYLELMETFTNSVADSAVLQQTEIRNEQDSILYIYYSSN